MQKLSKLYVLAKSTSFKGEREAAIGKANEILNPKGYRLTAELKVEPKSYPFRTKNDS